MKKYLLHEQPINWDEEGEPIDPNNDNDLTVDDDTSDDGSSDDGSSDDGSSDDGSSDDNGGGVINFYCKKCETSDGNVRYRGMCKSVLENGGKCVEFNTDTVADEINQLGVHKKSETDPNEKGVKINIDKSTLYTSGGELYLRGESRVTDGSEKDFKLKRDCSSGECVWFFWDTEKDGGAGWIDIRDYYTTSLHENKKIMKENMEHIPQMIDDKLREFNFYTIDPKKGKQKISFTDEDRESMKNSFLDMSEKYPEDIAFIRSVVDCRGIDDKTNQPFVRIGSYRNNSNINLPFKNDSKGLGQLLDSGINYFTMENNPTADDRDFKILPGDQIKDVEFSEESRQEMSEPMEQPKPQMKKEEPFEEVMKLKEKKGLASLVDTNEVNNNLSKKQKEIVEKLKKEGYLFKQPVDESGYDMREVKSKEFTESFKVWKKK